MMRVLTIPILLALLFVENFVYADSPLIQNPKNGHGYKRIDSKMSWHVAENFAEMLGGHLATITSQDEQDFLWNNLGSLIDDHIWLGATDEGQEGTWKWITGETFWQGNFYGFPVNNMYVNWAKDGSWQSEPDNYGLGQDYLAFFAKHYGHNGGWDDWGLPDYNHLQPSIVEWDSSPPFPEFLSLNQSRFKIAVNWRAPDDSSGYGTPVPLTSDSGYFWFFSNTNVELLVKILDGRGVNGHFWVFHGAMTDVQYTISVMDTVTGKIKSYQGQQGVQKSGNDINAFADSGSSTVAGASLDPIREAKTFEALMQVVEQSAPQAIETQSTASTQLFLNNNRFSAQVNWSAPSGASGQGTAVPLTTDSGYFWFFSDTNVELAVKVLDGTAVNGHFWFFWGAMTDVQYTITVTDTQTGAVKHYYGTQGVQQSGNDVNAF